MTAPPFLRKLLRPLAPVISALAIVGLLASTASAATLQLGGSAWTNFCPGGYHFVITGLTSIDDLDSVTLTTSAGGTIDLLPYLRPGGLTGGTAHFDLPANLVTGDPNTFITGGTAVTLSGGTNFNRSGCVGTPGDVIPEIPFAVLYPALGAVTFAAGYGLRRMRRRSGAVA